MTDHVATVTGIAYAMMRRCCFSSAVSAFCFLPGRRVCRCRCICVWLFPVRGGGRSRASRPSWRASPRSVLIISTLKVNEKPSQTLSAPMSFTSPPPPPPIIHKTNNVPKPARKREQGALQARSREALVSRPAIEGDLIEQPQAEHGQALAHWGCGGTGCPRSRRPR